MPQIAPEEPRPPDLPPQAPDAIRQAAAHAVARFELLLRLAPRAAAGRPARPDAEEPAAQHRPAADSAEAGQSNPECPPCGQAPAEAPASAWAHAAEPVSRRHGGDAGQGAQHGGAGGAEDGALKRRIGATHAAKAVTPDAQPSFDLDRLAERIHRMFRSTPGGADSWLVTLDLREQLPQTLLRIRASRTWLSLRFSTQSAESVRLLSQHMPELERQLSAKLDLPTQINVDLA